MGKTTARSISRSAIAIMLALVASLVAGLMTQPASAAPPSKNELPSPTIVVGPKTGLITLKCQTVFGIPVVTSAPLTQKHCDALEAIYNSTGGPNWTYDWHPGQVASTDPCAWSGVWCDSQVGVFRLELSYYNLVGAIPAEIGDLDNLTWLSLSANSLTSLPSSIGELTKLERLSVSLNPLTTLPSQIGDLTALEVLIAEQSQLSVLPSTIGNLSNLRILLIGGNSLASLPASVANLASLTELSVENNQLTSLPPVSGNTSLELLYVDGNNIGGSIADVFGQLGGLPTIERLGLGNNNLSGHVPASMSSLPLIYLEMSGNGCLTADAPTTAHLSTIVSFTGTADDALNVGCPKFFREWVEVGPELVPSGDPFRGAERVIRAFGV